MSTSTPNALHRFYASCTLTAVSRKNGPLLSPISSPFLALLVLLAVLLLLMVLISKKLETLEPRERLEPREILERAEPCEPVEQLEID